VRQGYERLLAYLACRTNDPAMAEDALAEAVARALERWPADGVPQHPEAWLLRSARNWAIDHARRDRRLERLDGALEQGIEMIETDGFPDERLKLLFACAHPAIAPADRTPLMLQLVLGMTAESVASAFAVPAATMGQRLVRAKEKIRVANIPFRLPDVEVRPERLEYVLQAVYAAYDRGRDVPHLEVAPDEGLLEEAVWLTGLLVDLMPDEAEALGLRALVLFIEARRPAVGEEYVPLSEQDTALWRGDLRREADGLLWRALSYRSPGRFQLEAAIQSAHMARRMEGADTAEGVVLLYEALMQIAPSLGAAVGHAMARAERFGAAEGLFRLDAIKGLAEGFQPYWAARAHLLERLGEDARLAYERAIALAPNAAMRCFLERKASGLPTGDR
jgi:RNA polymerase sigma-70 factor (ECF subfamily)